MHAGGQLALVQSGRQARDSLTDRHRDRVGQEKDTGLDKDGHLKQGLACGQAARISRAGQQLRAGRRRRVKR